VWLERDEDETKKLENKGRRGGKGSEKERQQENDEENTAKDGGKLYVNVRLVDFGARRNGRCWFHTVTRACPCFCSSQLA
jgi:hypothetical protein